MPVEPVHYSTMPAPVGIVGLLTGFGLTAIIATWEIGKKILRTRRARRMLAAGLDLKTEEKDNSGEPAMSAAMLEILRRLEEDRREESRQRDRQWNLIGDCVKECREHSANLLTVVNSIQNMALYMDNTHKHHAEQIKEVGGNVVRLSEFMRERVGGGGQGWPSFNQPPPYAPPRGQGGAGN